jgi:hypothetical protein
MIINIIDFVVAGIMLTSIYLIPKNEKFWLLYSFGCCCYMLIHIFYTGLYGYLCLEIVAMILGVRNYKTYRKIKQELKNKI